MHTREVVTMRKIVVIAGPTAVGKTSFAIRVSELFNGEIVSCDSMQLYRFMDIGSAKPTPDEQQRARHHLIDMIDPRDEFSVAQYQKLAKDAIKDILLRGKLPVISGGTGLYLNSLLYDMDFSPLSGDREYRQKLEAEAETKGSAYLHEMLKMQDPDAAEQIHPNNTKKIIRALERLKDGEGRIRRFTDVTNETKDYEPLLIGLTRDRALLYDRINRRVDQLVQQGLVDEVGRLMDMGLTKDDISMKGIGYKEIMEYLEGSIPFDDAVDNVKKNTRHYAKKQLTWFRRYDKMKWYDISDDAEEERALQDIERWLAKKI